MVGSEVVARNEVLWLAARPGTMAALDTLCESPERILAFSRRAC